MQCVSAINQSFIYVDTNLGNEYVSFDISEISYHPKQLGTGSQIYTKGSIAEITFHILQCSQNSVCTFSPKQYYPGIVCERGIEKSRYTGSRCYRVEQWVFRHRNCKRLSLRFVFFKMVLTLSSWGLKSDSRSFVSF